MIKFYLSQGQIGTPPLFIWIFYDFRDATLNGHLFSRNKTILLFYSWNKLSFCVKMQVQNMYVVILWICSVFAKGHTTIIIVTTWNMTQTKSSVAKHFFFHSGNMKVRVFEHESKSCCKYEKNVWILTFEQEKR